MPPTAKTDDAAPRDTETDDSFAQALAAAGIEQRHFRRLVETLTGTKIDRGTTSRWTRGLHAAPLAVAVAKLFALLPEEQRNRLLSR